MTLAPTPEAPTSQPAVPAFDIPETVVETLTDEEREQLFARIKSLLVEQDATLVAHYYTEPDIQRLADESGGYVSDSLDMARFGHESDSSTLVVAGVRFMGETAKILNPEKRVLMPDLGANCSLDLGCPADAFSAFCDAHPEYTSVVYANTSAEVKARADWVVTSGIAVDLITHLAAQGEKILWAPDKHLGSYLQQQTGCQMLLWDGACIVHERFKGEDLELMRAEYPEAKVLVHPESPASVVAQADFVGSTTGLIKAVQNLDAERFIVATDIGIFHKMKQAAPDKILMPAPSHGDSATCESCAHCPWMAMNGLRKLVRCLEQGSGEIRLDPVIGKQAYKPIKRLLDFAARRDHIVYGNNDA